MVVPKVSLIFNCFKFETFGVYMVNFNKQSIHPKWLKLFWYLFKLYVKQNQDNISIIKSSYDKLSSVYEDSWSSEYWKLSDNFVNRLLIKKGDSALDLFCGTGYITERVAEIKSHCKR